MTATRATDIIADKAQESVVGVIEKLVEEGKIANPAEKRPAIEAPVEAPELEAAVPTPSGEEAPPFEPPPGG